MNTYRLDYTIWNTKTEKAQHIKDDIVQFPFPKSERDILVGLFTTWVLLRGYDIQVGDLTVEQLSS